MSRCIKRSSVNVWAAAAGLLAGRYGFIAHSKWVIAGIPLRDAAFWTVAFLIVVSSWYALSGKECACNSLRRIQNFALPLALWTFGWYGFVLTPDLGYVASHDVLLVSLAVFSALPTIGLFAVCRYRHGQAVFYWVLLYVAASFLLVLLPIWRGACPGFLTCLLFLVLLSLAIPVEDLVKTDRPVISNMAVFMVSAGVLLVWCVYGSPNILLRYFFVLLGYLLPVMFLQVSRNLAP